VGTVIFGENPIDINPLGLNDTTKNYINKDYKFL
jgi:hypothetical protein